METENRDKTDHHIMTGWSLEASAHEAHRSSYIHRLCRRKRGEQVQYKERSDIPKFLAKRFASSLTRNRGPYPRQGEVEGNSNKNTATERRHRFGLNTEVISRIIKYQLSAPPPEGSYTCPNR